MVQYGVKRARPSGSRVLLRERWTVAVARVILVQQPLLKVQEMRLFKCWERHPGLVETDTFRSLAHQCSASLRVLVLVGEQRRGVRPRFLEILIVQW
jgi:hypothetical protein